MEQGNSSMSVAAKSTPHFAISQQLRQSVLVQGALQMHLPLRYAGGNLGLGFNNVHVNIVDALGAHFTTESVQWLLQHVEYFVPGRDQVQLLAGAAIHYGLNAYALLGADLAPKWNVVDTNGRLVLGNVSRYSALEFADTDPAYQVERAVRSAGGERHEGPLVLLHHNLGVTDFEGVAVKSHAGRCGMMLEEVLWRLDQFSDADQAEILAGLAKHFDMGNAPAEAVGAP